MNITDFFPFGSAVVGAVTGGSITYAISRSNQRKDDLKRKIELTSELKVLIYDITSDAIELEGNIENQFKGGELLDSDDNLMKIAHGVKNFFDNLLIGKWTDFYVKAVYITEEVFLKTQSIHKQLVKLQNDLMIIGSQIHTKGVKWYIEGVKSIIHSSFVLLNELSIFLGKKEEELIQKYIQKYIKEKKFFIF